METKEQIKNINFHIDKLIENGVALEERVEKLERIIVKLKKETKKE